MAKLPGNTNVKPFRRRQSASFYARQRIDLPGLCERTHDPAMTCHETAIPSNVGALRVQKIPMHDMLDRAIGIFYQEFQLCLNLTKVLSVRYQTDTDIAAC
ncbi:MULTISPECIES: hypothetical protein [unclassified Cupriavidus]|uniref:hypothetical protein n=1 Tax=unclassified Cupriavidus TaxID=2640874 RepID=UPI00313B863F